MQKPSEFRLSRKAGSAYLHSKFGNRKLDAILSFFHKWGTSALAASTPHYIRKEIMPERKSRPHPEIFKQPFPFPTSVFFGAAGASNYGLGRFLTVVTICRAARYGIIAVVADHYGRHFIRALRQPGQYWGWLLLFAAVIFTLIIAGIALNRRLAATRSA
jgi:hypothetical protein